MVVLPARACPCCLPAAKCVYVDEDFELITFDFVTEPSTHGAFLVPICKAYKALVPDQSKAVQISHLGHGVASMRNISRLPQVPTLVNRINELQQPQSQQQPGLQVRRGMGAAYGSWELGVLSSAGCVNSS